MTGRLLAAACLTAVTAPLRAQQGAPPADSAPRRLDSVVVTSGAAPVVVGGASAVVVRPDSLALPLPPGAPLDPVLRQVPFLLLRQNSRGESELSVRGSDSRQAAVLLDGLPLTLGWDHRGDPSLLPATGVQAVRVVRGLSTLLQGPNVLGGVVEHTTAGAGPARAGLRLATGADHVSGRSVTAGATLPGATRAGQLVARAAGGYRRRDGVALSRTAAGDGGAADPGRDDAGELRTNSDLRQADGFASVRLDGAGGRYVGLTASGYAARRGVPPELHLAQPRLWRYPDASRVLAGLSAGSGAVATPLGRARVEASAGLNAGDVRIESFASRAYATVVAREAGRERTGTARALGALALPGGGEVRAAATGARVRYDERLDEGPTSRYEQRLTSLGAELQLPARGQTTLAGGAAYDRATTPQTGARPSLGALGAWGWRAGVTTLALTPAASVHAAVSRRARFPALRELYSGALDRYEPNPALRPERLLGGEVGATVVGGPATRAGLSLQGVAFHHRLHDAVVRLATADGRFRRENRDELRTSGVELLAGWDAAAAGGPAGLAVTADLAVQRARVRDRAAGSERHAEHQPARRGSVVAAVPLPFAVRGAATARWVGRQYCTTPDARHALRLAGRGAADAALTRDVALARGAGALLRVLRATVAVDNVTSAAVYDQCGLPQPGRTVRAGVELR